MTVETHITLSQNDMPTKWYNIQADCPNRCRQCCHPVTKQPVAPATWRPSSPWA